MGEFEPLEVAEHVVGMRDAISALISLDRDHCPDSRTKRTT